VSLSQACDNVTRTINHAKKECRPFVVSKQWRYPRIAGAAGSSGRPFLAWQDEGAWTIPKGEFNDREEALDAARREFEEETGAPPPPGEFLKLRPVRQGSGKIVHAWAVEADFDPETLHSNEVTREWPPKSGRMQRFPEVDRAGWFTPDVARRKILQGQVPLIDELLSLVRQ
jgi:predicted NUDIX family NTP pyrophosphohydrolase